MRIAILSDVHGNLEALKAFREDYDELWVIGDLVNYGPHPAEVVRWVEEHAHLVVRGNHDHAIGFNTSPRCSLPYKAMAEETSWFTHSVLTAAQKRYLRLLPLTAQRRVGGHSFFICHAMPSDCLFGYLEGSAERWIAELELAAADVLVAGHTHVPVLRKIKSQTLLNPGSAGQPKTGSTQACYAVWEDGGMELKRYNYDIEKALAAIASMPVSNDVRNDLIYVLKTGGKLPDRRED
jgi:putative phosphoesterase